ncbi:MAG: YdeI/OmpD-associated family protein [Devosia sp.]
MAAATRSSLQGIITPGGAHTLIIGARGLADRYAARPAYQRNDYLMWINKAKRDDTRQKRIQQMLDELHAGDVYMRMKWNG